MTRATVRLKEFPDHPVDAAVMPDLEDILDLLAHPAAYDPEGDDGEPALILKGCVRPDRRAMIWVADQCTHSQMAEHLSPGALGMTGEFYILVRPDMEAEFVERETHPAQDGIRRMVADMDRAATRSRLGRFPRPVSPRRTGVAAFR
jgi:hypothetical protein